MKCSVLGKLVSFREIRTNDADFVFGLRADPELNRFLSPPPKDVDEQSRYIENYLLGQDSWYFIIVDKTGQCVGTVRIYDIRGSSFCWGSWILSADAPSGAGIESALLVYDYAFFALHFDRSHFDVRKDNVRVVDFHTRFGARIVSEDELNYYFEYDRATYLETRKKYARCLP